MKLTSPAFSEGGKIPLKYTCEGEGINPPLEIQNVPAHAKALVLIMDDPDVPSFIRTDQMYDHWIVFNLPPTLQHIEENTKPPGQIGKSTNGKLEYVGPCPPDRQHRYFFKLYALDQKLDIKSGASKKEVEQAMQNHIIAHTHLMGRYEKQKKA
ncbi:MAG TPA: YbhB/YbcL family Raf kinase inhibitor-like protein [Parachlamydiales bacterium]|nr:YbhB/YbcL family Raf kinase inhibitor-like protein [Parachlamydiales bacterium]